MTAPQTDRQGKQFMSFAEAREYVRKLNFQNYEAWIAASIIACLYVYTR